MRSWLDGKYARDVGAYINDQAISFKIDDKKADLSQGHVDYKPCLNPSGKMKIVIYGTYCETKPRRTWEDVEDGLIEKSITEIVIAVVEAGERQYRYSAQRSYEFILQRKAKLIEEARIKKKRTNAKNASTGFNWNKSGSNDFYPMLLSYGRPRTFVPMSRA